MSKKRIVIFGWSSSVHVQRWVKGLTDRGYEMKVISCGGDKIESIPTTVFPRDSRWAYFKYAKAAAREAMEFKPDLVHVHYAGGFGLWGNKIKKIPYLLSVWGSDIVDLPEMPHYRFFIKRSLKKADKISATSRMLKERVSELVRSAEKKTEIIPFGVEVPNEVAPPPSDFELKICYIKGHRNIYGPDVLLEALAEVKKVFPKISLSMAGEGEITDRLKRMTERLGLTSEVTFSGFIDNNVIYDFIRQHHIMVMPSLRESFGVAVLEASACGRPVIASNVGGVPEVVKDGETGYLIKPNDPSLLAQTILRFTGNPALIEEMGQNGYNFIKENYSWEKSLDMMSDLYERMINGKS